QGPLVTLSHAPPPPQPGIASPVRREYASIPAAPEATKSSRAPTAAKKGSFSRAEAGDGVGALGLGIGMAGGLLPRRVRLFVRGGEHPARRTRILPWEIRWNAVIGDCGHSSGPGAK